MVCKKKLNYSYDLNRNCLLFLNFIISKILKSKEFKPLKYLMPDLKYLKIIIKDLNSYKARYKGLHNILMLAILQFRYISFFLFGNYDQLFRSRFLPKYKIITFFNLIFEIRCNVTIFLQCSSKIHKFVNRLNFYNVLCFVAYLRLVGRNDLMQEIRENTLPLYSDKSMNMGFVLSEKDISKIFN